MNTITFETKCYENDWRFLLRTPYLDEMIKRCGITFQRKQLIINNVKDIDTVRAYAEEKVRKGVIDTYYIAADYEREALDFFQIDRDSFGKGYYYSIAELVGIYLSETTYHLHFSSDAIMAPASESWIPEAIALMDNREDLVVANPAWNRKFKKVAREAIDETEHRRAVQSAYNEAHGITPRTIKKAVEDILEREKSDDEAIAKEEIRIVSSNYNLLVERDRKRYIADLTKQMTELAKNLEFEKAALIRDEIQRIKDRKDLSD